MSETVAGFTPTDEDVERAASTGSEWARQWWSRAPEEARDIQRLKARETLATIGPIVERERRAAAEVEVDRFAAELAELRAENERLREALASVERERRAAKVEAEAALDRVRIANDAFEFSTDNFPLWTEIDRAICNHEGMSRSGADQSPLDDPGKVWLCDNCGRVAEPA